MELSNKLQQQQQQQQIPTETLAALGAMANDYLEKKKKKKKGTIVLSQKKQKKITGTTDVVVAQVRNVENDALRALVELKTPENIRRKKNHNPQVVCEHIAASYLNRDCAVVSVLTDSGRSWTFYWFACQGSE